MIYLYVKQHIVTGMKYFGMTRRNPFKYNGSGKYWKRHVAKYGKDQIKTVEVYGFDEQSICTEFALRFSHDNNIVESREWANLQLENGVDGALPGKDHHIHSIINPMLGKTHTLESRNKIRRVGAEHWAFGKTQSDETKKKRSNSLLGRENPRKGVPASDKQLQHLKMLAESRRGVKRDEDTLRKMSENRKGKGIGPQSADHIAKRIAKRIETVRRNKLLRSQVE